MSNTLADLKHFYRTWVQDLSAALRTQRRSRKAWATLLRHGDRGLELFVRRAGDVQFVGLMTPSMSSEDTAQLLKSACPGGTPAAPILLRLSPDDIIERVIQIPTAARDVIEPVLMNQLERIVPWPAEATRYGYHVATHAAASGHIDVTVVATKAGLVRDLVERATTLGLAVEAVDYAADVSERFGIELQALAPDRNESAIQRLDLGLKSMAAASMLMCVIGIGLLWHRSSEDHDLQARLASLNSESRTRDTHEGSGTSVLGTTARLLRKKENDPTDVALIEALSRALPDSAYLSSLEIRGRDVRMSGEAEEPTTLITQIEQSPAFKGVRFSAPTTREKGASLTTFSILAEVQDASELAKPDEGRSP